jgi:hypothetical protein
MPMYLMFDHTEQQIVIVARVKERLAVNTQRSHSLHTERFDLKKLNEVVVKSNFMLRSQIGLQLWKIWMQRWKLIVPGKRLERI